MAGREKVSELSQVTGLLERLGKEISDGNACADGFIDDLQMFQDRRSVAGLVGLEAKLAAAERQDQIEGAQAKKELFAKLMEEGVFEEEDIPFDDFGFDEEEEPDRNPDSEDWGNKWSDWPDNLDDYL